jgi:hypothetical protein
LKAKIEIGDKIKIEMDTDNVQWQVLVLAVLKLQVLSPES